MRSGYILDTLTSVDFQKFVKIRRKVVEIYEDIIYRENFKLSPFRKFIEKLFASRKIFKEEGNDLMQELVDLIIISFPGVQIRKSVNVF